MASKRGYSFGKRNDNWSTPRDFFAALNKEFHFDFDPNPINPAGLRDFDGLGSWEGKSIFCNPPYSQPKRWIEKAIEESKKGKTVVLLLKCDTSTSWFHDLVYPNAEIRFIRGRLKWSGDKQSPFPSMLAIFRGA